MNKNTLAWLSGIGLILVTVIWGVAFVVVKNTLDAIPAVYLVALLYGGNFGFVFGFCPTIEKSE